MALSTSFTSRNMANNKMGICVKLSRKSNGDYTPLSNAELELQFALMVEMGAKWFRDDWFIHKFTSDGVTWNFTVYDNIVNRAAAHGLKPLAIIEQFDYFCPVYARRAGYDSGNKLLTTAAYEQFCTKLAEHYQGRVDIWELGNEPNGSTFWGNQPPNAANYVNWYQKPGYAAIKAVDPTMTVVTGGLSQGGWGGGDGPGDCDGYLAKMYLAGLAGHHDGFGIHPYTRPAPPNFTVLDRCRNLMILYNEQHLPIYITEVGFFTGTAGGNVSESLQAQYLTDTFNKIISGTHQYIPFCMWYNLKDDGTNLAQSEDNYGLVRHQNFPFPYQRKPAFYAFKALGNNLVSPLPTFRKST